jgi:hypothetical protein
MYSSPRCLVLDLGGIGSAAPTQPSSPELCGSDLSCLRGRGPRFARRRPLMSPLARRRRRSRRVDLTYVAWRPPVSPVEVRPPEPPHSERHTSDQEHDFEHGDHVGLLPPRRTTIRASLRDFPCRGNGRSCRTRPIAVFHGWRLQGAPGRLRFAAWRFTASAFLD